MFKLLKEIAHREGIGDLMAEGGITFGVEIRPPRALHGHQGYGDTCLASAGS